MNGGLIMKNKIKEWFALTNQGASDLLKASMLSFLVFFCNIFPAILLMILVDELLLGNVKSDTLYIGISIFILVIMYILLAKEYDALYSSTYRESANLRTDIATTLSNLPLAYFSKHDLSDISQTVMKDVEAIEHAMSHAMAKIIGFVLFFPIMSVLMLVGNIYLGLSIIIPVVLSYSLILVSKKLQLKNHKKHYDKLRQNSDSFQEAIELQQDIKSFGLGNKIREKLNKDMDESEKMMFKMEITLFIPLFLSWVVTQGTLVVVVIVGANLYANGSINLLYLIGYIFVAMKMKDIVDGLGANTSELFYLDARIKRIKEIKETKIQEGKEVELNNFDIELKNVKFGYDKKYPVLKDVSFIAKQNEVTALVGVSGCGKTSILKLISRLYDYDDGKIVIDNHDIKDIATNSLYKYVSIVFQDVVLFNTSILENIRIGRSDATDEEVIEAAKAAHIHHFIKTLPGGYNMELNEEASNISQGQKQLLTIARAILANKPILILDEATSSVDTRTEVLIQKAMNKLMEGRTTFVIAHRLSTIRNADKILVLKDGDIIEQGNHNELLEQKGFYSELYQSQFAE